MIHPQNAQNASDCTIVIKKFWVWGRVHEPPPPTPAQLWIHVIRYNIFLCFQSTGRGKVQWRNRPNFPDLFASRVVRGSKFVGRNQKEIENFLGSKLFRLAAKNAASWWFWGSNLDFTHTACSQLIKIRALPIINFAPLKTCYCMWPICF
jgi:hypothetical protein